MTPGGRFRRLFEAFALLVLCSAVACLPTAAQSPENAELSARQAFQAARDLAAQQTRESFLEAIARYEDAAALWERAGNRNWEGAALSEIAEIHLRLNHAREAITCLERAQKTFPETGKSPIQARVSNDFGAAYLMLGDLPKARDYLKQSVDVREASGEVQQEDTPLHNLAYVCQKLGDNRQALTYYEKALRIRRDRGDLAGQAQTLTGMAIAHGELGDNEKALEENKQALEFASAAPDREVMAVTMNNIGKIYLDKGEPEEAIKYFQFALPVEREVADASSEFGTLINIGLGYQSLGYMQKALDSFQAALQIAKDGEQALNEGAALNDLGMVYDDLGDKTRALDHYSQALALRQSGGDRAGEAGTLHNLGQLYEEFADTEKAIYYLTKAQDIWEAIEDRSGEAKTLYKLGVVYERAGDLDKALHSYELAYQLQVAVEDRSGQASTLNNIGGLLLDLDHPEQALPYLNQALSIAHNLKDRNSEHTILSNIAGAELLRGNLDIARTKIEEALQIVESQRTRVAGPELRTSYFSSLQFYWDAYIDILMQLDEKHRNQGYDRRAFEASERARARSLLDLLSEAQVDIRQGVEPQLLARERALLQDIDLKSASLNRLMNGQHTPEQAEAADQEVKDLLSKYQELEGQVRSASPKYAALKLPHPLSADEVQHQVLDSDTVLIAYSLGRWHSYMWVVTDKSLRGFALPKREDIETLARDLHRRISQVPSAPDPKTEILAAQLALMLLSPARSELGRKRLVIVADGVLNYVPFGMLPAPYQGDGQHKPLVVDHEIVYLPSASTVALLRRENQNRVRSPKLLAVIADPVFSSRDERVKHALTADDSDKGASRAAAPGGWQDLQTELAQTKLERSAQDCRIAGDMGLRRLRYSRREADSIAALVSGDQKLEAVDFNASKSFATNPELAKYRIVHFATHGLLNSDHPELSGVVLSLVDEKGATTDGFLRLNDVFNLSLPADLVVLSACQTGLGKEISGEGVIGLTRGFMYAGARRVVVSLWNVNDPATAELMRRFYQSMLKDGMRPSLALQAAQTEMWRDPHWGAPYYWAAFVIQGDWR